MQLSLNKLLVISASYLLLNTTAMANPPELLAVNQTIAHDTSVTDNFLMGKYTASKRGDFSKISTRYASRAGMYMQSLPYDAFKAMYNDAKNSGVNLKIISATRSFYHQKSIWEAKWKGKRRVGDIRNAARSIKNHEQRAVKILEYSSMPGSSRHHWGTDIDLNAFTNKYFASGQGKKTYNWLVRNASRYGFCQPYTAKGERRSSGYNEEKWHWSFQPLSQGYVKQAQLRLTDKSFTGFAGSSTAARIGIINKYVLGIDPSCY